MTGEGNASPGRPYTLQEADDACLGRGPAATEPPRLTVEDAILLLLCADSHPIEGKKSRVRRALVAAARALRESGVEPVLFSGGRRGPSTAHINDAVEQLAFSNRVHVSGGRGSRNFAIEITPRGRAAIKEKHESLPPAARAKLARIRAGLDAPRPRPPSAKTEPAPGGAEAIKLQKYASRGDRLFEEGKYDEAYANYKLAATLCASDAGLRLKMAHSMVKMGLYKDALRHCREAIRADPAGADAYIAAGRCLNRLGRHAEAVSHHQRAAGLDPGSAPARQNASFSLFQLGRYEEALRQVEAAASISPKDPVAHARIATCLSRMGRHEEAASAGRRAVEAAPNRVDSYLLPLSALHGLGRYDEALELCGRAAEADPGDPRPHFVRALTLRALGRQEEALAHCQKAIDIDPSHTDFRTAMSLLLRDLGRLPEALSHCEAVVSVEPGNLPVLSNMGSMLADMGRHKEALACLDRALRLDPKQPVPRYNRALSLQETGNLGKALREYRRVVKMDPGNAGAYNNMGTVLSALGRDGEALAHFDRALGIDPGNAAAHLNKALSLQHLSLHKDALAHFDRALGLSPGNADAYVGRLSCLDELGLPDREIDHYAGEALGPATEASGAGSSDMGRYAVAAVATGALAATVTAGVSSRLASSPGTATGGGRPQLVRSLLSRDESRTLEFKSWPASRPDRPREPGKMEETIAKELCSFANTDGGDLLVGVGDGGKAEGLAPGGGRLPRKERDKMLAWLTNVIVDYLGANHDGLFDREIVGVDGLDILHCRVAASEDGPVILKKRLDGRYDFFVRAGSSCRAPILRDVFEYVRAKWPEWTSRPRPTGPSAMEQRGIMAAGVGGEAIPPA